jgi:hypothetical protein
VRNVGLSAMAGTFPRRIFLMDVELLPDGFYLAGLT